MKLYDLRRDTRFNLVDDYNSTVLRFDHIDADFAVCYLGDAAVHINANAEIEEVSDG